MLEESVSTDSTSSIWASMNSWFTSMVLFVLLHLMIATIYFCSTLPNQPQQQQQDQAAQDDRRQPKLDRSPSVLQRLKSINLYTFRSHEHHLSPQTITHFKQTLDSDTHYHHEQTLETQTHYLFEQTHQQEQQQTLESQTHYIFEQTHQQDPQQTLETQTHYLFEHTHHPQTLETQTQYVFEQTHQPQQIREKVSHDDDEEEDGGERQTLDEIFSQLTDSHVSRTISDAKPASGEVPARLPAKMWKSASSKSAFGHFGENDVVEAEVRRPATVRERRAKATEVDDEVDAKADDFINKFKQQLKLQRLDSIIRYKEMVTRGSGK